MRDRSSAHHRADQHLVFIFNNLLLDSWGYFGESRIWCKVIYFRRCYCFQCRPAVKLEDTCDFDHITANSVLCHESKTPLVQGSEAAVRVRRHWPTLTTPSWELQRSCRQIIIIIIQISIYFSNSQQLTVETRQTPVRCLSWRLRGGISPPAASSTPLWWSRRSRWSPGAPSSPTRTERRSPVKWWRRSKLVPSIAKTGVWSMK